MQQYQHTFHVSIDIPSLHHRGDDVTGKMIREALLEKLEAYSDELLLETTAIDVTIDIP
ncbi:hypothetical protein [Alteromonas antoniana]|jgi:hypothetical protein|uniref:hypothetical protein n=1 Tax=Alteromonas antoniana TaxID=2803813 RepID=UPI001C45FF25|nr:hypothetical protein [Alteromonas antoniana]|tara:strand:+ start:840 stop:1016 length:177 start_codon:yes stop_codon:yes gene_type:complete